MTLAERATESLRMALIDGTFLPGQPLTERQACKFLGMSRSPIRTALQTLANEGLVIYEPNRGYRIRRVSFETVEEAYLVRGTLEGLACRLVARAGLSSHAAEVLTACVDHGRMLLDCQDVAFHHDEWREMNSTFHRTILDAADNEALLVAFRTAEMHPMASLTFIPSLDSQPDFPNLRRAQIDHEQILSALCARDGTRATSRMREHVEIAGEIVVREIRDHPTLASAEASPAKGSHQQ